MVIITGMQHEIIRYTFTESVMTLLERKRKTTFTDK